MNQFLQNKWVVSFLGVAAAAILALQFWPESRPASRSRSAPTGKSSPKSSPKSGAPSAPTAASQGGVNPDASRPGTGGKPGAVAADRQYLAEHFIEWRESPVRDPFDSGVHVTHTEPVRQVRAQDVLSLTAIWRQTGDRLAVVNSTVVGERDTVAGYRVQSILGDSIWVVGENGREHVPFGLRKASPAGLKKGKTKSKRTRGRR